MSESTAPTKLGLNPETPRMARFQSRTLGILSVAISVYLVLSYFLLRDVDLSGFRMRLDVSPLLAGTIALQIHVASAITTFAIGLFLLSGLPKGTRLHRRLGWSWVVFMASTAISSFFLVGLNGNHMSWIHGLSAWTVIILPFAVVAARRHDVKSHAKHMRGMFLGGMLVAGLFSFLPGRMMWSLFFAL